MKGRSRPVVLRSTVCHPEPFDFAQDRLREGSRPRGLVSCLVHGFAASGPPPAWPPPLVIPAEAGIQGSAGWTPAFAGATGLVARRLPDITRRAHAARPDGTLRSAQPCLKAPPRAAEGECRGRSPFAGGTGVSPVFGYITPFLARKGGGGMVERAVERQRRTGRAEVSKQSRFAQGDRQALSGRLSWRGAASGGRLPPPLPVPVPAARVPRRRFRAGAVAARSRGTWGGRHRLLRRCRWSDRRCSSWT